MSRVLVTGGAGRIGSAVVRRLLRDPDFEVRVADRRPAPVWMREGAEVHAGDLQQLDEARKALRGCSHVIHLAAFLDASQPFTRLEVNAALDVAVVRAALDTDVERCTFVSAVGGDTAQTFGEALCQAAHEEHGLRFTVCRPAGVYGPGFLEHPVLGWLQAARAGEPLAGDDDALIALTEVSDVADAIVLATAAQAGLGETFAIAAAEPMREVAELCWTACGNAAQELVLTPAVAAPAEVPSAAALERAIGWRPRVMPREGIARSLASLDHIPGGN